MAAGLDVRRDWPVARVDLAEGGVSVTSTSGETESGSHVVVTVPLGVLKNDVPELRRPRFRPSGPMPCADSASGDTRRWR